MLTLRGEDPSGQRKTGWAGGYGHGRCVEAMRGVKCTDLIGNSDWFSESLTG